MAETWYLDLARIGIAEGHRIIAARLNLVFEKRGMPVKIVADPVLGGDSIRAAAEKLRRALPGLRTLAPFPDDSKVALWTLGFINDPNNQRFDLFAKHWCRLDDGLQYACRFLEERTDGWTESNWRERIQQPCESVYNEWLEWLDSRGNDPINAVLAKIEPTSRESMILKGMLDHRITGLENRKSQSKIVLLTYRNGEANDVRRAFIKLRKLNLVNTGEKGRGFFLTPLGVQVAERLIGTSPVTVRP